MRKSYASQYANFGSLHDTQAEKGIRQITNLPEHKAGKSDIT